MKITKRDISFTRLFWLLTLCGALSLSFIFIFYSVSPVAARSFLDIDVPRDNPEMIGDASPLPGIDRLLIVEATEPLAQLSNAELILRVNYDHDWIEGNYEAGHTVWITVTDSGGTVKATAEMPTEEIPGWDGNTGFSTNHGDPWQPQQPDIQPGDFVHGAVSTGYTATVEIGQVTGFVDVDTDTITGTLDAAWLMPGPVDVDCQTWGAPDGAPNKQTTVTPNGSDVYTCAWDPATEWDVQPGQDIGVFYDDPAGRQVGAVFQAPVWDLILNIDYYDNWIEGYYEPGYTVWLTVTNSSDEVKAVAKMPTGAVSWWGDQTGFSTNDGNPWHPSRPNIEPGDWVHGFVSSGYTATVQIGQVSGEVDVDADTITGTVDAAWLNPDPGTVDVECQPRIWPEWAPNKQTTVTPDGSDVYTCAWNPDTEWDVLPGQKIAVGYREPVGHQIYNVFHSPILEIHYAQDWIEGEYEPGHTVWITVTNGSGTVKATATMTTQLIEWWNGRSGFSTTLNDPWQPERPDIQPGDWVQAAVDDGWSTAVQIGEITGAVDVEANHLVGTVDAPWIADQLTYLQCNPPHDVTRRAQVKYDWLYPDGVDTYNCAWDPEVEWDIQPGEEIRVFYRDVAGHKIWDAFYEPRYDLILDINYSHNWIQGRYEPGYTVWLTVTNSLGDVKGTTTEVTDYMEHGGDTGFSWNTQHFMIQPGDWIHGMVNNGYSATVQIGQLNGFIDVATNSITGTVDASWLLPEALDIECQPWIWPDWPPPGKQDTVFPDGTDTFSCAWDPDTEWDMQLGQEIWVQYQEPNEHRIMRAFPVANYDLLLTANYDEDWISGPYAPEHTVWLTVTDSVDVTKATIELYTDEDGFSTDDGNWQPARPDIVPGDHVYGQVDNGRAAEMRVGEIAGFLDIDTNTITGTVDAAWLGTAGVDCYAWDAPDWIPHKNDSIMPDGSDPYACAWDASEWNIRPGHNVAVGYGEPGGHQVVQVFSEPVEPPVYAPADVVATTEPSVTNAITRLEASELDIYAAGTSDPDIAQQIADSDNLEGYRAYGSYNELTFNPAGPIFAGTGKLNPFAVPRVREAMNWLVDRNYIVQEIVGGLGVPRWHALNTASSDYAELADVARELELHYAYDKTLAQQVIAQEMSLLGATRVNGLWHYGGEPVEIILLIRTEDKRMQIGDYVGDQLEDLGFTVTRDYRTSAEASPIWISGNPEDGQFHIYTGGWITTQVPRDLADNFAFFYTDMGLNFPLWQAYENTPEFYALAQQLQDHEFATLEERRAMMAQALEWAAEDSVRVWLYERVSITPRRAEVSYAADLYSGMIGSWLWPHTLTRTGSFTTPLTIGTPSFLNEPWNPLSGSSWVYDRMFIHATGDNGVVPDPFTGLNHPQRIESAAVTVQAGLPVSKTHDWVTLNFEPEIVVPDDAWVDWNADTQQFLTAAEVYGEPQTALRKSVVTYPADLTSSVTWHDGSPFSLADVVLNMILAFDRNPANVKAVRIVSEDPLVIETYSDDYQLDAEQCVTTWWPYYERGPGAWHNLALGLLAEEAGTGAFSQGEAEDRDIFWLDYVAWPGLLPLEEQLTIAQATNHIPYTPTLDAYVTPAEATTRWNNLTDWHTQRGHLWIGTGPLYLERVFKSLGELLLKPYAAYPDDPDRWSDFGEAPIAEVSITGPESVPKGAADTFDVNVTFQGDPYAVADIDEVRYLLFNAQNEIAFTDEATAVADGHWRVTLTEEMSNQLLLGLNELEIVVSSRRVAVPTFATHAFETTGLRVVSVTPISGLNDTTTPITIGGRQFATGATATLLRSGTSVPLDVTYVSATSLEATVPGGLEAGTYALRVTNPDDQTDTLLSAFTVVAPTAPILTSLSPTQGPNDLPVTLDIYGSNFAPGLDAALHNGATFSLESLYFVDSTHLRADVPISITLGEYTLTITNPNGLSAQLPAAYTALDDMDDLFPRVGSFWLDPLTLREDDPITPTMGIVVRRAGGEAILDSVPVDFYYQTEGGSPNLIGRAATASLAPDDYAVTAPLAWDPLPAAGTYTLRAVIDPDGEIDETVENNNVITRTVTILPSLPDTVPPVVQSLRINNGESCTAQRQIYLNATAQDNVGGSGVANLLYVEYIYVYSQSEWVPVASSGWLPYTEASSNHAWALIPTPGVHYIRAWAADAAGNISLYWRSTFINLVPTTDPASISTSQIHTYRFHLQADEGLSSTLTSITGDTDVYVFGPDDSLITYSFSEDEVEGVNFVAAKNGIYQVEIFGYLVGTYRLQFAPYSGEVVQTLSQVTRLQSKTPRSEPLVSSADSPEDEDPTVEVPSAPLAIEHDIYLPLVLRNCALLAIEHDIYLPLVSRN